MKVRRKDGGWKEGVHERQGKEGSKEGKENEIKGEERNKDCLVFPG